MSEFGNLLRQHRLEAGFSQESLAERAGLSVDAIGAYERGLRSRPYRTTIASLVEALQLSGSARHTFERLTHRRREGAQKTPDGVVHNAPRHPTSFVGRQDEIRELGELLPLHRLITITGSGGIGKTRCAVEIASRTTKPLLDGVWFVELTSTSDPEHVIGRIATSLGIRLARQNHLLTSLLAALTSRETLVILDNCEHVIDKVREVASAILRSCPKVAILATSRELLRIEAEVTYKLSNLPFPSKETSGLEACRSYDAFELFADRAATSAHGFEISDENVEDVSAICRRLDGIALAIELAAGRLPLLGIRALREQLAKHFKVASGGHLDVHVRQRTLRATIMWSHDLLSEPERALFRRLSIFVNGWTLEAAESVCNDDVLPEASILDLLFSLVEKSLVNVDLETPTPRYSFFESTREFAVEQRLESSADARLAQRHALWIAAYVDDAFDVVPKSRWEPIVITELDNAIAGLEWALGLDGDPVVAGRIVSGLRGLWITAGLGSYFRESIAAALAKIEASNHPALVARLLLTQFQFLSGNARVNATERALLLLEGSADQGQLANCCMHLSFALAKIGRYSDAERASAQAAEHVRAAELHQSMLYANVLANRSQLFIRLGRIDEASRALAEALNLAQSHKDAWCVSLYTAMSPGIQFAAGNPLDAIECGEKALAGIRQFGKSIPEVNLLCNLACFYLVSGELGRAASRAQEALSLSAITSNEFVHEAVQHLATVATLTGKATSSARLLGFVDAWQDRSGYQRNPNIDKKGHDILMDSLSSQLDEHELSELRALGAQLTEDAAILEALSITA